MTSQLLELLEYNFWANDQCITRVQNSRQSSVEVDEMLQDLLDNQETLLTSSKNKSHYFGKSKRDDLEARNIFLYNQCSDWVKSVHPEKEMVVAYKSPTEYSIPFWKLIYAFISESEWQRALIVRLMQKERIIAPEVDFLSFLKYSRLSKPNISKR